MFRIVAICPQEYVGVASVFRHGEALGYWKFVMLNMPIPECDALLLGAWHPQYAELVEKYKCGVYITSTVGQMEFSNGQVEFEQLRLIYDLLHREKLKFVLAGWDDVLIFFNNHERVFHCPYPFFLEKTENIMPEKIEKSIGIFLPSAPRKNLMNQYFAARMLSREIYTNLILPDKAIHATGWLERAKYIELMGKLTTTLHCTFTESFSYGAAESLMIGTIPIVSYQVAQNLGFIQPDFTCFQCDSIISIAVEIKKIFDLDPKAYQEILTCKTNEFIEQVKKNTQATQLILDKIKEM